MSDPNSWLPDQWLTFSLPGGPTIPSSSAALRPVLRAWTTKLLAEERPQN